MNFFSEETSKGFFSLVFFLQDILENESINLDWMFRYSLINDIVKVRATPEPVKKKLRGRDAR